MSQDLFPDPGPDDAEPDGFPLDEDAPGPEQGLFITLPAEHLTVTGFRPMPTLILARAELSRATALAKTPIRFDGTWWPSLRDRLHLRCPVIGDPRF
jgi:hypothetical protein